MNEWKFEYPPDPNKGVGIYGEGFYININKSTGAIIAKCEIEKAAAAIVEAITAPFAFREYLEATFEYED